MKADRWRTKPGRWLHPAKRCCKKATPEGSWAKALKGKKLFLKARDATNWGTVEANSQKVTVNVACLQKGILWWQWACQHEYGTADLPKKLIASGMLLIKVAARWKFSAGGSTTQDVARKVRSMKTYFLQPVWYFPQLKLKQQNGGLYPQCGN